MLAVCRGASSGQAGYRASRGNRGAPAKSDATPGLSNAKKPKKGKSSLATTTCFNCLGI